MRTLVALFWEFFKISLFVIGGGYSMIVVANSVLSRKGWIKEDELIEHLPVFQMVPGLIATHTAVYVGRRVAGGLGAVVAVVAVAIPSIGIFTLVSMGYRAIPLDNAWLNSAFVGLRAALTGIIAATIIKSWRKFMTDAFAYALLAAGVLSLALIGVPVWAVLVASMACGIMSIMSRPCGGTFRVVAWWPLVYFLAYGSLCFGGGFVIVPMYLADFVGPAAPYLQLTGEEFSNIMAVSQMTPGPIGVNCATFFGYRLAGVPGAIIASAFLLLPGSLLAWFVFKYLDLFRSSRVVSGILRGVRPASIALMLVALAAFARMTVWSSDGKFHTIGAILVILTVIGFMKKKLNVILLIILCAASACILRADEPITAERFPDADAVVVNEIEHVEYQPDGTSVSTAESWSKILTERGRRDEGVIRLGYNKRYGEAKILYVGAIDTNGVERAIDVSGTTKEMSDNSSMSANIVDPLDREIVCTIPGLAIGETVHAKIERRTVKSRVKDQWSDVSIFEWTHPIVRSVYEVKAPKERPIMSRAIRHPLGNMTEEVKTQADGSTLYVYTATNSPRMFPEPDMPPTWTQVQSVHLSTARDWRELSRWYWEVSAPHLARTTPAMTNLVEKLGRDMRRIFTFVSQEVRYMGLTMEDTAPGYAPHDVNITFDNRYGVCRDKAALLVALLRIAGYKAYPVLINVGAKMDPDVPKPYFNHAITCVEEKGRYVLMDSTNENTKDLFPAYLSNCSYLVARPEGEALMTSPVPAPEGNSVDVATHGDLRDDGTLVISSTLDFTGINDTIYRGAFAKMTPEQRNKFFEQRMKALQPGAELVRCEISPRNVRDVTKPLRVELLAKLPESVLRGETQDALIVPFVSRPFSIAHWLLAGNTALEKRRYPLVLDTTARVKEHVELDMGGSVGEVKSLPPILSITNGYAFACTFAFKDRKIVADRTQAITVVEFDPEAYGAMREDIKRVEALERKNPIFATDALKNANIRWMVETTDVDIADDFAWTVTNTVVKEVLTYRGKKDAAEVKLSYNPTWKHVEVLTATVSNLNGVVSAVKPVEMNEMDAGWVASAPRYPASKMLVVNLPAVEIGSVITLKTAITVTNAPAAYYGTFGFDAHDPLECRRVRVNDWSREVRASRRIPVEPHQPSAWLWRDVKTVSRDDFHAAAARLRAAIDVEAVDAPADAGVDLLGIRDWMARHVRVAGPDLYEVPLAQQLTAPDVVLKERYGTRLDYMRTLCALLKGAGYDADIVFAARNAGASEAARNRDKFTFPNVRAFASALCRVRVKEGGFFGLGGTTVTYYLSTENEHTPLDTPSFDGCDFFDPAAESFGVVTAARDDGSDRSEEAITIQVRANGAVDYRVDSYLYGAGVGAFRKRYKEILPEDFSRHYQALLGNIAQAASATSELHADTISYPAHLGFECFVPDYAVVEGDTITLELPALNAPLPALSEKVRETPVALSSVDLGRECVKVRFPAGYEVLEHGPANFRFCDPRTGAVILENRVTTTVKEGVLEVCIERTTPRRSAQALDAAYAALLRDWRRRATSADSRTLVVRKRPRR